MIEYINKNFSIKLDNYEIFDKKSLENLKNEYLEKSVNNKLENFNLKKDYSFKIYLFYLLIIIFSFSFYFYNNQLNKEEKNEMKVENNFEKLKKEYSFTSISSDFDSLMELVKKHNLNLKSFEYKENKQKIVLSSSSKSDIYAFFNELKDNLISQEISYFENEKIYESVIYVKLSK